MIRLRNPIEKWLSAAAFQVGLDAEFLRRSLLVFRHSREISLQSVPGRVGENEMGANKKEKKASEEEERGRVVERCFQRERGRERDVFRERDKISESDRNFVRERRIQRLVVGIAVTV